MFSCLYVCLFNVVAVVAAAAAVATFLIFSSVLYSLFFYMLTVTSPCKRRVRPLARRVGGRLID